MDSIVVSFFQVLKSRNLHVSGKLKIKTFTKILIQISTSSSTPIQCHTIQISWEVYTYERASEKRLKDYKDYAFNPGMLDWFYCNPE